MILNLIKTSIRNLQRFKLFSLINIIGLAFGMALVFIILLFVWHEFTADQFHENYKDIYRIETAGSPSLSYPSATILRQTIPEIKGLTLMYGSRIAVKSQQGDADINITYQLVDDNFFGIFSFPLVSGDKKHALSEPNSIVLSESVAKKIFGEGNPVGKVVSLKSNYRDIKMQMVVTGVMKDIPSNSSIKTEAFIPIEKAPLIMGKNIQTNWKNWSFQVFVLLHPTVNIQSLLPKINRVLRTAMVGSGWISQSELEEGIADGGYTFTSHPLSELYFLSSDTWLNHGNKKLTSLYLLIAMIILLIAVINYINLSTSIASQRAREIGFRKLLGADKKNLFLQIFFETLVITLIAFIFSLLLIELFLPAILNILPSRTQLPTIYSPSVLLIFFSGSIIIAFLSGVYPAIFLFRFKAMDVVKSKGSLRLKSGILRSILILFQFTVSAILIFSVILVQRQLSYLRDYDPGYKQENIISVRADQHLLKNVQSFKNSMMQIPGVKNVSCSENIPSGVGSYWGGTLSNGYEYMFAKIRVDTSFSTIFGLQVVNGQNFREALKMGDDQMVIINEEAARRINAPDVLNLSLRDEEMKIVGVVKDFNFFSAKESTGPLMLVYTPEPTWGKAIIELTDNKKETINKISKVWDTYTDSAFDYSYVKNDYDQATGNEEKLAGVITGFTVISLILCFLGLFGLVSFMLNRRINEMGIRKVLGATHLELMQLLSKEFIKLVLLANVIGLPIAWYLMNRWLDNFPNRINISWWMYFVAGAVLLVLSTFTILIRSNQMFRAKVVDALKYE